MGLTGLSLGGIIAIIGGLTLGLIIGTIVISVLISALFLYLGCRLVKIYNATFVNAIITVIGGGILVFVVNAAFAEITTVALTMYPTISVLLGIQILNLIMSVLAYTWTIKVVFNTTWWEAFLALIASAIVGIIGTIAICVVLYIVAGVSLLI